jgi:hypothetical protein
MKKIFRQIRLLAMTWFLGIAIKLCPKDAIETLIWFTQLPLEK